MGKTEEWEDWNEKGKTEYERKNYENAIKHFRRSVEINPQYKFGWFNLGNCLDNLGRTDEALEAYKRALDVDPNYRDAANYVGLMYFIKKEYRESAKYFERVTELDPDYQTGYFNAGDAYFQLNENQKALPLFLQSLELNPEDMNANNKVGLIYFDIKDYESAIKHFKRAAELDPDYQFAHYNIGDSYYQMDEYDKAIPHLRRALELDPNYLKANNKIGLVYFQKSDYKTAAEYFKRASENDPNYKFAHYNTGDSYYQLKDYNAAIPFLKRAIELDPDYLKAVNKLGLVYWSKDDFRTAIQYFTRATEIDPTYKSAWYNIGSSYNQLKEYENGIAPLEKAIKIDPNYRDAHNRLGIVFFNAGRYSEAIPWFIKTYTLDPKFKSAPFNAGNSYRQLKDYSPAIKYYTEALLLDNNYERAWKDIAECYEKLGKNDKAEQARNRTLKLKSIEKKKEEGKEKFKEYIHKLSAVYKTIQFHKIIAKTGLKMDDLENLLEDMIMNGELNAHISGDSLVFKNAKDEKKVKDTKKPDLAAKFKKKRVKAKRGGNWKIEGGQSVFFYKVKVQNESKFLIGNIQVVITSIPRGLSAQKQLYKIESLKPGAYESPTFKLMANESCVGDTVEGIVTFTDPMGKSQTITIEPFEICYVCNLLTPKEISKKDFDEKVEFMEDKKLIIDSDLDPTELEARIAEIVMNCNFAMLQQLQENTSEDFRKFEAFAEGLYDKQDVALSIAVKKVKGAAEKGAKKGTKKGSKIVIKAMSDKEAKIIDILKDFNIKLDDIKSDTELIKEYSAQLDIIFDKTKDLEGFLIDKLGSDFNNIKHAFKAYKAGEMGKTGLIKEGLKMIGKKFIKKLIMT